MFDTFVGIVSGNMDNDMSNDVTICIMDVYRQDISIRSFELQKAHIDRYLRYLSNGRTEVNYTADMHPIGDFLNLKIRDAARVKVLLELPKIYPLDAANNLFEPVALVNEDSIYLKLLTVLSSNHYISWLHTEVNESRTVALFSYTPQQRPEDRRRLPKYLNKNISKVYGDFLLGLWDSDKYSSIIAALIAKNIGAYYYWSSLGIVQSPQDVASYLKIKQQTPTQVINATESYMTSIDGSTKFDDLEKISLEYATTYKQYEHIGENNAMKAALLQVCKLWNIVLSCTSFRNDAEEVDKKLGYSAAKDWEEELERYEWIKNSRRVYPCANNDLWIITRIQEKQI